MGLQGETQVNVFNLLIQAVFLPFSVHRFFKLEIKPSLLVMRILI